MSATACRRSIRCLRSRRQASSSTTRNSRPGPRSPKGDQAVIDGAKSMAMTALDLMMRPDMLDARQSGFRSDGGAVQSGAGTLPRKCRRSDLGAHRMLTVPGAAVAHERLAFSRRDKRFSRGRVRRVRGARASSRIDAHALQIFETGARYHMYHALAMGLAALAMRGAAAPRCEVVGRVLSRRHRVCSRARSISSP